MRYTAPVIAQPILPFGVPPIDQQIGGGLDMAALHEVRPDARSRDANRATRLFVGAICNRSRAHTLWIHCGYWSDIQIRSVGFYEGAAMVTESVSDQHAVDLALAGSQSGRFGVMVIELENITRDHADVLDTIARHKSGMVFIIRRRRDLDRKEIVSAPVDYATRWAVGPAAALPGEASPKRLRWRVRHLDQYRRTTLDVRVFAADQYGMMAPIPT